MKAVLIALMCFFAVTFATSYTSCGSGSLTLTSLTLNPDPPVAGQNLTVSAVGSLGTFVFIFKSKLFLLIYTLSASTVSGGDAWMNVSLQYQGWQPVPGSPFQFPVSQLISCKTVFLISV